MRRVFVVATLALFFGASAWAQSMSRTSTARAGPPIGRPFHFAPPGNRSLIGLSGVPLGREGHYHGFGRSSFFYGGWPYFPPEYEDSYQPAEYVEPPPPRATAEPQLRQEAVPSAALLELQGNQWVKVTSFTAANNGAVAPGAAASALPAKELPPTILVYRDGHSEELSSYSIIGSVLYTKADYFTTGDWTRKIQMADVDIPATVKRNQDRGLKFDLPSGPNEVILRP